MLSIRFYIGLEGSAGKVPDPDIRDALDLLSNAYPNGITVLPGEGRREGKAERSMIVEAIVREYSPHYGARKVAIEVARMLSQSCVGLAFSEVAFELVKPQAVTQ